MRTIWLNEDDAHFYSCHPAEDMTVAGLQRLVDYYVEDTQVAGLLFCCSMQKALFDSRSREPLFEDYDPNGGPDQPVLRLLGAAGRELKAGDHARNWLHNLWLLSRGRGIDHPQVWLDRCRHHRVPGWLTIRMNDAHGLKEYVQRTTGVGDYDGWCLLCPSHFWKEHPELRRAPYRWERSWEAAYDYAQEQVRAHQLVFITELCQRYDFDGLELDWMRWGMNFRPGHERAGRAILTQFIGEVRKLVDACALRVGHPVELGVRIPAEPRTGWNLGYDAPGWAQRGLVQQVVIGGFGGGSNFDVNVEEWRLLTGGRARLLVQAGGAYQPYPHFPGPLLGHDDLQRGVCANALSRGADGVYLFNDCYRESGDRDVFKRVLQTIGDLATLATAPRRQGTAFAGMNAAGDPIGATLPIPLTALQHGYDYGRMEDNISVRLHTGPVATTGRAVLHLAFSPDTPPIAATALPVRLNTVPLTPAIAPPPSALEANVIGWCKPLSGIGFHLRYEVPLSLLLEHNNLVEFVPPKVPGELRWAEVSIHP